MNKLNYDLKIYAFKNNVKMYEISNKLGIHYVTLNGRLRKELSKEEKEKIIEIINQIVKERN